MGGIEVDEPSADLGIALAVATCARDVVVDPQTVIIGEIGLSGEIRSVGQPNARLKEAHKLGFNNAITPPTHGNEKKNTSYDMNIYEIGNVQRLINWFN
jgi:DNA repair protein RadA/Sms